MEAQRWQEIEALFDRVLDLPPEERTSGLEQLGDGVPPEIVAEVARLIAEVERSTGFLATARSAAATEALNPLQPGESIGSWTVKRPLGAG
ncbi:MAG: hypothetical protein AAGE01_25810, partial [Pseudomonadota bacterium]